MSAAQIERGDLGGDRRRRVPVVGVLPALLRGRALREDAGGGALDVAPRLRVGAPELRGEQDRVGDLVELQAGPVAACRRLACSAGGIRRRPAGASTGSRARDPRPRGRRPRSARWPPGRGRATTRGGRARSRRASPRPTPSTATRCPRRGRSCPRGRPAPSPRRRRAACGPRRCAAAGAGRGRRASPRRSGGQPCGSRRRSAAPAVLEAAPAEAPNPSESVARRWPGRPVTGSSAIWATLPLAAARA